MHPCLTSIRLVQPLHAAAGQILAYYRAHGGGGGGLVLVSSPPPSPLKF